MPQLPIYDGSSLNDYRRPSSRSRTLPLLLFAIPTLLAVYVLLSTGGEQQLPFNKTPVEVLSAWSLPSCPVQPPALAPDKTLELPPGYREESAARLSAAVQIPSISYDDNGLPTEDPRWAPFFDFQNWLADTFAELFARPEVTFEKVNTLGILTTIQGSDRSLKPLLLLSHYDVTPVPAATVSRWTHPPFSGHNDGQYIWGRGSGDTKQLMVAQYEALSLLLSDKNYVPRRTILLSHGFDEEEVFARQGAGELAKFIEARYGKDSILLAVDEGTSLIEDAWGVEFAIPATSEKGYLDVVITVGTSGGHSSVPPAHTGIGIAAEVIRALEGNPYPNTFSSTDPVLGFLICGSEYSPRFPSDWKSALRNGHRGLSKLADKFASTGKFEHALVTTTQAIDVINGGAKVNSLPEEVIIKMNHRIQFSSNLTYTRNHLAHTIRPVADAFNLTLVPFSGKTSEELGNHYISVDVLGVPLEPAPIAKTSGGVWELFAGSIKEAFPTKKGKKDMVVSPFGAGGNTDTKVYHNLSRNIYRFNGSGHNASFNAHTVDERTSIDSHLLTINWIWTIVQNADAYTGEE